MAVAALMSNAPPPRPPLCVELEGCIVRTDLLHESLLQLVRRNPVDGLRALLWRLHGQARLQHELALRTQPDPACLPYNTELLEWLRGERAGGREVWLCTRLHETPAHAVADHLRLFDGVIASRAGRSLAGRAKAAALVDGFGGRAFHYCGHVWRGRHVWSAARALVLVGGGAARRPTVAAPIVRTFPARSGAVRGALWRALRPREWAGNVLVFVPLIAAAHGLPDPQALARTGLAFLAFCLWQSSLHVLGGLMDLPADRRHPRRRHHPFAAGELPPATGMVLAPCLLGLACALTAWLPPAFAAALAGSCLLRLAYALGLKDIVLLDGLVLAGLYGMRIAGGALAAAVPLPGGVLATVGLMVLSLALLSRYSARHARGRRRPARAPWAGVARADLPLLKTLGVTAGYAGILLLALRIHAPGATWLHRHAHGAGLLCAFAGYWISRLWLLAERGTLKEDPLVFALHDRPSLALALAGAVALGAAG